MYLSLRCVSCGWRDVAQKGWHFNPQLIAYVSASLCKMWLQPLEGLRPRSGSQARAKLWRRSLASGARKSLKAFKRSQISIKENAKLIKFLCCGFNKLRSQFPAGLKNCGSAKAKKRRKQKGDERQGKLRIPSAEPELQANPFALTPPLSRWANTETCEKGNKISCDGRKI